MTRLQAWLLSLAERRSSRKAWERRKQEWNSGPWNGRLDQRGRKIWGCKIGEIDDAQLPDGADEPMRRAVEQAYRELTGEDPRFTFSGWSAELDEFEQANLEKDAGRWRGR